MARGKTASSLDLPLPAMLPSAGNGSKRDCVIDTIRDAIVHKLLLPGSNLPSSRALADRWKISRGTVESAFDLLFSEGYITRAQGSGTRVSEAVPDSFQPLSAAPSIGSLKMSMGEVQGPVLHREHGVQAGTPFVARLPAKEILNESRWKKHAATAIDEELLADPNLIPCQGAYPLREQIATYLRAFRGLSCHAGNVFITSGIRQSLDNVARLMLSSDSKVAVEDPGYRAARTIFEFAGAHVVNVPVDAWGIQTSELEKHIGLTLVYVTPAHQSPLGVTLSAERRLQLLDWAAGNDAWIVEDDYDGEFSYRAAPFPALKSQDERDRVIYCSSFNKTVHTGIRVGFMVVPAKLNMVFLNVSEIVGSRVNEATQRALASFMASGDFANHLRRSRHTYQQRRDAVLRELERYAYGKFRIVGDHAGFHFVLRIMAGTDETTLVGEAQKEGIMLQPLQSFCYEEKLDLAYIIGYSALSLTQAGYFGKKLGLILDRVALSFAGFP